MEQEHSSIHEFDFNLICAYFSGLERQGPGSPEQTIRALRFIEGLTDSARIADLGCGTGGQTRVLASHAPGHITGLDLFSGFIDRFNAKAAEAGLDDRLQGLVGSMDDLPFETNSLDLIWAEGSIYNIGYQKGLAYWRDFLKKDGWLAVTEACWFTTERPEEIDAFWKDAYPEIDTIPAKMAQLQAAGYVPVASFILPETCWTDCFYRLQVPLQEAFLREYPGNPTAEMLVTNQRREAELYDQYKAYYGYVFFIGRKIG